MNQQINAIYQRMVRQGMIKEVPANIAAKAKEKFINYYSRFDARLEQINRDKISCQFNEHGFLSLKCSYYKCAYGQVYVIDGDDVRTPTMND